VCRGRAGGDPLPCRAPIPAVALTGTHTRGDVRVSLPRGATPIPVTELPRRAARHRGRPRDMVGPTPLGEDERLAV